jgi:hypothetical protein
MAHTCNPRSDGFGGQGLTFDKCEAHCDDVGAQISFSETFTYTDCQVSTTTRLLATNVVRKPAPLNTVLVGHL